MEDFGSVALRRLLQAHAGAVQETHAQHGDATALVSREAIAAVMRFLHDDPETRFDVLVDVTAVDYLEEGRAERFEVVYHLFSLEMRHRVRIKVRVPEADATVDTIVAVWPAANWLEREVWDMYGIRFRGHPDPRRLLLYEEFQGHPLRKDYPKERRQPLVGPVN
jgi:NADH-quinone oxidoreductase subunit C